MRKLLGPVLHIGQCDQQVWRFHISFLLDGPSNQQPANDAVKSNSPNMRIGIPQIASAFPSLNRTLWQWPVEVDRNAAPTSVDYIYAFDNRSELIDNVAIPAIGHLPSMAFFSCNGFSDDPSNMSRVTEPNGLWTRMKDKHDDEGPFHLLIGGGDQVYADSLWYTVTQLKTLRKKSIDKRIAHQPSGSFAKTVLKGYVDLYCERWSQHEPATMMARVPGIFTWDDHDIFDGWGSFEDDLLDCNSYQAIFAQARTAFEAFQLGGRGASAGAATPPPRHVVSNASHFLQALQFDSPDCGLDVLLLDLRSDRKMTKVMSEDQWKDVKAWLNSIQNDVKQAAAPKPRHLLVISSIPVVYRRFAFAEGAMNAIPFHQGLEDDLRDQWESGTHEGEREQLINVLLEHGKKADCVVSIVSGDVHRGSRGLITSKHPDHVRPSQSIAQIEQLTSSAIVHPPPGWAERIALNVFGKDGPEQLTAYIETRVSNLEKRHRYLEERNWLAIRPDKPGGKNRIWAQWITENREVPKMAVIQP